MRSLLAPNNHQQFGNLVTLPLLLITLIFTPIHQAQAKPFDFFSYDWDSNNALVVFNYKAGDIETLHSASLTFFAVDDCQKALLASYKTQPSEQTVFSIKPLNKFALLSDKTYQIATKILA